MTILQLRKKYHAEICKEIIRIKHSKEKKKDYPNSADIGNIGSIDIAWGIVKRLGCDLNSENIDGQTVEDRFEIITKKFLEKAFNLLLHLRPGNWVYSIKDAISNYAQYRELADLNKLLKENKELASILGQDYIISPDIVIGRLPVTNQEINKISELMPNKEKVAALTPFITGNLAFPKPILHASISCKWTIRSDRVQNSRAEALNLIRNRKGKTPHIAAVTAEPLPSRIASLALGTGDLDCVYHFALYELRESVQEVGNEDQKESLKTLIEGRRLRDISDLPFDLIA